MKTLAEAIDVAEIRERVGRLTLDDARCWGVMGVHQMVCHVRDSYEIPMGERAAEMAKAPPGGRRAIKFMALRAPMNWPHGIKTVPEVDQQVGGTRPVEFAADVASLLVQVEGFAAAERLVASHPIFGPMTRADWMRWGYLHADHHLRQFGR